MDIYKKYDEYSDAIQFHQFINNNQNDFLFCFKKIVETTDSFSNYLIDSQNDSNKKTTTSFNNSNTDLSTFKIKEFNFFTKSNFFKVFKQNAHLISNLEQITLQTFEQNDLNIFNQHIQKHMVISFHSLLVHCQENNSFWLNLIENNLKQQNDISSCNDNPLLEMNFQPSVWCCHMFFRYSMLVPLCCLGEYFLKRFNDNWENCFSRFDCFVCEMDLNWNKLFQIYEMCCDVEKYIHGLIMKKNPSFGQLYEKNPLANNLQSYMFLLYICMIIKIFKTQTFCALILLKANDSNEFNQIVFQNKNSLLYQKIVKCESQSKMGRETLSVSVYNSNKLIQFNNCKEINNETISQDSSSCLSIENNNLLEDSNQSQNGSLHYSELNSFFNKSNENSTSNCSNDVNEKNNLIIEKLKFQIKKQEKINQNKYKKIKNRQVINEKINQQIKQQIDQFKYEIQFQINQLKTQDIPFFNKNILETFEQIKSMIQIHEHKQNISNEKIKETIDEMKSNIKNNENYLKEFEKQNQEIESGNNLLKNFQKQNETNSCSMENQLKQLEHDIEKLKTTIERMNEKTNIYFVSFLMLFISIFVFFIFNESLIKILK